MLILAENLHLYTTTLEPPVFEDFNITTAPWAELGTDFTEVEEMHTLKVSRFFFYSIVQISYLRQVIHVLD